MTEGLMMISCREIYNNEMSFFFKFKILVNSARQKCLTLSSVNNDLTYQIVP